MGWLKRFMARRGAIRGTAKWACIQYAVFRKTYPDVSDKEIVEKILALRYAVVPLRPQQKEMLEEYLPKLTSLADLAYTVLAVESDDRTSTSPFRDDEWVSEVMRTIWKVIDSYGLQDIEFDFHNVGSGVPELECTEDKGTPDRQKEVSDRFYEGIEQSRISQYQDCLDNLFSRIDIDNYTLWSMSKDYDRKSLKRDDSLMEKVCCEEAALGGLSAVYLQIMIHQYFFADPWVRERYQKSWAETVVYKSDELDFFPGAWNVRKLLETGSE